MGVAGVAAVLRQRGPRVRTRERKYGHPSDHINVRVPRELAEWVADQGRTVTAGTVRALDYARDALGEIGEELLADVELRAVVERCTEGEALGRFAREAIEAKRGKSGRR